MPFPEETTIEFLKNNTWKASKPINQSISGKWSLEKNERKLLMACGDSKKEFLILELSAGKLKYQFNKFAAVQIIEWSAQ